MAVIGTFGSYTAARLGIYASQSSLNVTGNNIANINTKGYTRQRLDLASLHSAGVSRYQNGYNLDIGYGVLAQGTSQLRDPFLDIRYRDENASVGFYEAQVKGLQQLSNILDEVGMGKGEFGIIEAQFNDFLSQLQGLNNRVNDDTYDTTVRSSAESLVTLFNTAAKRLAAVKDDQLKDLKADVDSVNTILTQIRELNVQIRDAGIYGDKALELRDARNVLIDDLSAYMKIDVSYDMEKLDEFSSVERLNISLADSGNPPIKLIQGIYGTQLSMPEQIESRNPDYDPEDPRGMQYISWETDRNAVPPKVVLTDDINKALRDANGDPVANNQTNREIIEGAGNVDLATVYDPTASEGMKYLDENGQPTDDITKAKLINNAMEKADDNRLWMRLEPLVDEKGRFMKDQYGQEITEAVDLGDNDLFGSLQAKRELLTEEGEFASEADLKFDPNANIKRGIPYYQRALDSLARKFADTFNRANTDDDDPYKPVFLGYETETGPDGVERYKLDTTCNLVSGVSYDALVGKIAAEKGLDVNDPAEKQEALDYLQRTKLDDLSAELQMEVKAAQAEHLGERGHGEEKVGGGVLFSNHGDSDDPNGITAANISIANSWSTGDVRILSSKNNNPLENTTSNDNIYHMINLMSEKLGYKPDDISDLVNDAAKGSKTYFEGSFQQYLANINNTLGTSQMTATVEYTSYESKALNLDNQRQSVSGVDLNEEATNMMQFQKSYSAACQLMTTLDSMLDKLINDTIR